MLLSIAKEKRWQVYLLAFLIVLLQWLFGWIVSPLWLIWIFVAYLLRDYPRKFPSKPLDVLAPVDGEVISIEEKTNLYLQINSQCISIRQNRFGEFNLHSPTEGTVRRRWWPGKVCDEAVPENGFAWWIQTDEKDDLVLEVVPAVSWLRSIRCLTQTGERIGQGKRCGFAGYALDVQLFLPAQSKIIVKPGDRLLAGQDSIAVFQHG
ncbi:MAG TPA: phosphatidylserine decarboxylase [Chromatiales bacterium]|nr:phosphatidylserine decarboxylase [Thiotrichales bacterium]HIP68089.1 phosphatidylserine decarboxylase [Chromatiales bacterium]